MGFVPGPCSTLRTLLSRLVLLEFMLVAFSSCFSFLATFNTPFWLLIFLFRVTCWAVCGAMVVAVDQLSGLHRLWVRLAPVCRAPCLMTAWCGTRRARVMPPRAIELELRRPCIWSIRPWGQTRHVAGSASSVVVSLLLTPSWPI